MINQQNTNDRAILVDVSPYDNSEAITESRGLAISAGVNPVAIVRARRTSPTSRFYIGKGQLNEVAHAATKFKANLILFDNTLSARQERNLETYLEIKVVDRSRLILDIFARRAKSFEGKLQVELAQLNRLANRLVRGWTHLERQKGGIGLRGPGETQLETDKRLIGNRIAQLQQRLERESRSSGA